MHKLAVRSMTLRYALSLTSVCAVLAGCATAPSLKEASAAWNGVGQDENAIAASDLHSKASSSCPRCNLDAKRKTALARLEPDSAEWLVLHDEIEADREKRLKAQLRICDGCLPAQNVSSDRSVRSASDSPSSVGR